MPAEPKERNCKRCGTQMNRAFHKTKDGKKGIWVFKCESCAKKKTDNPPQPPSPQSKHWLDDYV